MDSNPIKRSQYLVALSRDHHTGLLFCWKIRTGIKKEVALERINKYIVYYWNEHLKTHFEEEETLLFEPMETRLSKKAVEQHVAIRQQITKVTGPRKNNPEEYLLLEQLVNGHIRFEERELFPFLEVALSKEQLIEVGERLKVLHDTPLKDDYADEFWV
jgi:hemerythrin-like domain-containing protein